jgi:general secretion pathway protein B
MSYILEALRKAERERSLGQVPTLEVAATPPAGPSRRLWPWLLAAALLVNAGVLAVWLLRPSAPETPPPLAQAEPAPVELPTPPPPAVADYMPPPTTVVEEPIVEPPVAELLPELRDSPASAPAPAEDYTEAPAVEETPPVSARERPALRDMPPEFRRSLPEMKVDAHFYTTVPGRSFVMVNLRKYKPGERLVEGPQVVEIVSEGAVLSFQGQEFLLTP